MENCRAKLIQGVDELRLQLSAEKIDQLLCFIQLIAKWNKAYNLTAVRDLAEMVSIHLLDSLAILPHVKGSIIADIGTGAGLPGIPLAICKPDCQLILVDSNSKKTRFVQQAVVELKLKNVQVVHARVEEFQPQQLSTTVISRAFASMQTILDLTEHLLADTGVLLAMKGQAPVEELQNLGRPYQVIKLVVPGIDAERCLIELSRAPHD